MISRNSIIEDIYRRGIVKEIIKHISHGFESGDNMRDLEQDIYIHLLEMDDEKLNHLYENDELNFYLASVIYRQIRSATSPYYQKYKKFDSLTEEYDYSN